MIQLLINNKPAHIKQGTTFKLTRVNPYFADQGDYTLELQLPLKTDTANLAIFGPRNHTATPQHPHLGDQHTFQLIAPPLTLTGTATVTSITDTEIKVQLKAGPKATPLGNDTTYIDQLPLGNCWDQFGSTRAADDDTINSGESIHQQKKLFSTLIGQKFIGTNTPVRQAAFGTYPLTDAIIMPTYSETNDTIVNPMDMITLTPQLPPDNPDNITLAPQPYLLDITRRIFQAIGLTPDDFTQYTNNPLTRAIYIVNTRQTIQRAKTLPHWTIKEYLTQLQNLLGCVFTITGNKVSMHTRQAYYNTTAQPTTITQLLNTHTININTDNDTNTQTTTTGNADYDHHNLSPMLRLPDEVWQNAITLNANTYAEARQHYDKLTDYHKTQSPYLYHITTTNRTYAILLDELNQPHLTEVDQYAPLLRNTNRDQITKLSITPATMLMVNPFIADHNGQLQESTTDTYHYPLITEPDTILTPTDFYNVNNAINTDTNTDTNNTDTTEPKDHLNIAWYNGPTDTYYQETRNQADNNPHTYQSLCPIAIPYTIHAAGPNRIPTLITRPGTFPTPEGPFLLANKDTNTQSNTYGNLGQLITQAATINTNIELQAQFTDQINPDPTQVYLIGSRRYACHKLELTIDQHGIQPIKQGYFYEIQ